MSSFLPTPPLKEHQFLDRIFSDELEKKCKVLPTNNNNYDLVYSISDIHGDYEVFKNIITNLTDKADDKEHIGNKVILYNEETNNFYWNPKVFNVCIIQTGDIMDGIRSSLQNPIKDYYDNYDSDDLKIIDILINLKEQAESSSNNNKIILLYGNHEIENIFNLIDIQKRNFNNYLKSDKSKLSEIDYCTFDENELKNITPSIFYTTFNKYFYCESLNNAYSIPYKDINLLQKPLDENIKNCIYNKQLIINRFTSLNKLKDKIICNYQTYAIINNYLFCHSGFISKFISHILNIYNESKTKTYQNLSLEEFINKSLENPNQEFINIINKSISKIINFIWNIYNENNKELIETNEELLSLNINEHIQNIRNIVWNNIFRDIYTNNIENSSSSILNVSKDLKNIEESFNFIINNLHLKGIIMGHIANKNIREITVINKIQDLYVYLTDIAMSRSFYDLSFDNLNSLDTDDKLENKNVTDFKKGYYIYNKYYNILQINKDGKLSFYKILNNFNDNIVNRILTEDVTKYDFYNSIYNNLNKNEIIFLFKKYINNNKLYYNIDFIKKIYNNELPEELINYLIQDYPSLKDIIKNNSHTYIKFIKNIIIFINNILFNNFNQILKSYISQNKLNFYDLLWISYLNQNKELLEKIKQNTITEDFKSKEITSYTDGLLKIIIDFNIFDYNLFILFYNNYLKYNIEQIINVINEHFKKIILSNCEDYINKNIIDDLEHYNYILNLHIGLKSDLNKSIIEKVIISLFGKEYYTSYFKEEYVKEYFNECIQMLINIIYSNIKDKILSIEYIINKLCSDFITRIFNKCKKYLDKCQDDINKKLLEKSKKDLSKKGSDKKGIIKKGAKTDTSKTMIRINRQIELTYFYNELKYILKYDGKEYTSYNFKEQIDIFKLLNEKYHIDKSILINELIKQEIYNLFITILKITSDNKYKIISKIENTVIIKVSL